MKKVVIVGACGLDRMLLVPEFPVPDSKIRTTDYVEMGGGNAANVAVAMSKLVTSADIQIKLCTKIGDDYSGQLILDDLKKHSAIDIQNPLFLVEREKTTGQTTIIVSAADDTRTCLHSPGSCGDLSVADLGESFSFDEFFQDVVHVHSDGRHTLVSAILAREARKRSIPVSVDAEKDRNSAALDELIAVSNQVFTNQHQIDDYLTRLTKLLTPPENGHRLVSSYP